MDQSSFGSRRLNLVNAFVGDTQKDFWIPKLILKDFQNLKLFFKTFAVVNYFQEDIKARIGCIRN